MITTLPILIFSLLLLQFFLSFHEQIYWKFHTHTSILRKFLFLRLWHFHRTSSFPSPAFSSQPFQSENKTKEIAVPKALENFSTQSKFTVTLISPFISGLFSAANQQEVSSSWQEMALCIRILLIPAWNFSFKHSKRLTNNERARKILSHVFISRPSRHGFRQRRP